jgi:hypothetical protein
MPRSRHLLRKDDLIDLLQLLADHPELVWAAGRRARQAYETHFTRKIGVSRITAILRGKPETVSAPLAGNSR